MFGRNRILGGPILLSPNEAIVAGGAAEAVEQQLQSLLRSGRKNVLLDLRNVPSLDGTGIRALVRAHTTAQRLQATFRIAGASPSVRKVLDASHLGSVFAYYESLEEAQVVAWPWRAMGIGVGGTVLCATLVLLGLRLQLFQQGPAFTTGEPVFDSVSDIVRIPAAQPFIELGKLVAAALIGVLVTAIHRPSSREQTVARSMAQAQILLCVSGALMMILIGNSLPRAFGIAGAASIIRFRTPVDDPKDVTILFILMGLGMATGLGALAVAGLGAGFLCLTLLALDRTADPARRMMAVEVVAEGRDFPSTGVEEVFARNHVVFEPREITQGKEVTVKFQTWLDPRTSLDDVSSQLMRDVPGIVAVGWQHAKRA